MSASRDICREQVVLFRNYHGYPSETVEVNGKAEITSQCKRERSLLIDAFERWCENDEHARATGLKLLEVMKFCPKMVEIREAAEATRAGCIVHVIGVTCGNACNGSGYIVGDKDGKAVADYCRCHPGRSARPRVEGVEPPRGSFRTVAQIIGERGE